MKRRLWYLFGTVLLAMSIAACDGGGGSEALLPPVPVATETAAPMPRPTPAFERSDGVSISAPMLASDALSDRVFNAGVTLFIADRESGLVWILGHGVPAGSDRVRWTGDDTLVFNRPDGAIQIGLGGDIRPVSPLPTLTPAQPGGGSASGAWVALQLVSGSGGVGVAPAGGDIRYRVNGAHAPVWAPVSELVAMSGNYCRGFDVFVFDPEAVTLANVTETADYPFLNFIWNPGGAAITAFALPSQASRAIDEVAVHSGVVRRIVELPGSGELIPLAWNPSGTRLLFLGRRAGRGFCDGGGPYEETFLDTVPNLGGP